MEVTNVTMDDFSGGIDRRDGTVTKDARRFLEIVNYYVDAGGKLRARPPLVDVAGLRSADSQAIAYLNGKYITIAKQGGPTIVHTLGVTTETLYFDAPEYTGGWELLDLLVFNEQVVALIRHEYECPAAPYSVRVHVWDDKRPTWVEDPGCPTSWKPSFPLHTYGVGETGEWADVRPVLEIAGDRLIMIRADGNTAYTPAQRPRIWSDRSASDILENGRWWYWVMPQVTGGVAQFTIPIPFQDFAREARYAAYVLERCLPNGSWLQVNETFDPFPAVNEYRIDAVTNRYEPTTGLLETRLTINYPGVGRILRLRALAKPAVRVLAGCYIAPTGERTSGIVQHEGADNPVASIAAGTGPVSTEQIITVPIPGAPVVVPVTINTAPGGWTITGQQRYWCRAVARVMRDGGTGFSFALTGSMATTINSTVVVGTGSLFLAEAPVGTRIEVGTERREIIRVLSNTQLEVDAPFTVTAAGVVGLRDVRYLYAHEIGNAGNAWYIARETEATLELAASKEAGFLPTNLYDPSGGTPVALAAMQNRLLVQFPETIQMWAIGPVAASSISHLATDSQGAGSHTRPTAALVDSQAVLPTYQGPRLFSPNEAAKDYLVHDAVGDKLRGLSLGDLTLAVWWPNMRCYVTCRSGAGVTTLWVLSYHRQERPIRAWSTWELPATVTQVDDLFVTGNRLYVRAGRRLHYFDAAALGTNDTAGPRLSRARWLFNHFGQPAKNKQIQRFEISQEGTSTVRFYMNPYIPGDVAAGPPAVEGITLGQQKIDVMVEGPGIAVEIESVDPGHVIDFVSLDYKLLKR